MKEWSRQNRTALILVAVGLIFLWIGLAQGGYMDTFRKAVKVCLECIGIG